MDLGTRARGRNADREAADLGGGRQVAFDLRGRDREGRAVVVESTLERIVGRKQRGDVDVDGKKVADGVVVLDAVETMEGSRPARIGALRRDRVDRVFEEGRHGVIRALVWSGHPGRRHRARTQPPNHRFPHVRIGAHGLGVEHFKREAGGGFACRCGIRRSRWSGPHRRVPGLLEAASPRSPAPHQRRSRDRDSEIRHRCTMPSPARRRSPRAATGATCQASRRAPECAASGPRSSLRDLRRKRPAAVGRIAHYLGPGLGTADGPDCTRIISRRLKRHPLSVFT